MNSKRITPLLLSLVIILSSLISFSRELVFSFFYGATAEADAFNAAVEIPTTLFSVVSVGIQTIVIPLYSKYIEKGGQKKGSGFISALIILITIITFSVSVVCIVFSDFLISILVPGMSVETKK